MPKRKMFFGAILIFGALIGLAVSIPVYFSPAGIRVESPVVYGQRDGQNLMLDVWKPAKPNGKGLVFILSGNWQSEGEQKLKKWYVAPFLRSGYTIIGLGHVSQPEASVPEIVQDVMRGIRYIRYHSADWGIDAERLGIVGSSSGGHLALCVATMGSEGVPDAEDPVDRCSSRVQAAAVFYPVTDLIRLDDEVYFEEPPTNQQVNFGPHSREPDQWPQIARSVSPLYHVSDELPPVLLSHGDADPFVPIGQSQRFKAAADRIEAGPVELIVHPGRGHGSRAMLVDLFRFCRFFKQHL